MFQELDDHTQSAAALFKCTAIAEVLFRGTHSSKLALVSASQQTRYTPYIANKNIKALNCTVIGSTMIEQVRVLARQN